MLTMKPTQKTDLSVKSKKTGSKFIPLLVAQDAVDPSLALLFASSAGPVKAPSSSRYRQSPPSKGQDLEPDVVSDESQSYAPPKKDVEVLSNTKLGSEDAIQSSYRDDDASLLTIERAEYSVEFSGHQSTQQAPRKRKRNENEDDIEGKYMLRIAKEEEKEEKARQAIHSMKRPKMMRNQDGDNAHEGHICDESGKEQTEESRSEASSIDEPPSVLHQHEALAPDNNVAELEKASRTVFLANVSATTITDKQAKKALLEHMSAFLDKLPVQEGKKEHKIESIRFRSTAYAGNSLPKKAAFAKKNLMEATTKSTNAYIVYSTAFAAREAVKTLNGTMVLDRHLRVDGVAHPAKTDHRRCVFVGNLGFVDDESMMDPGGENDRKRSKIPSDVEEGLWRQFSKAGSVESVRVVRDEKTRVGKGFAYVQFHDANSVEAALLFQDKKFPPMLPRMLRVTRARALKKTALASKNTRPSARSSVNGTKNSKGPGVFNPRISDQRQSLQGRAGKMLGRAGAARFREGGTEGLAKPLNRKIQGIVKTPEDVIFEGYRASPKSGRPKDLKLGKSGQGKKGGKPKTRSSKRASEWKKKGKDVKV